jgi:hypothetical protein
MRWHVVIDGNWKPAHTPWDEPAEINLVWHEEGEPPLMPINSVLTWEFVRAALNAFFQMASRLPLIRIAEATLPE